MDEQNFGVTTSTDAGSGTPSSDPAVSSGSAPSDTGNTSQVDPFVQFASEARAANIADTSNDPAPVAQPVQSTEAKPENEGESATPESPVIPENNDDLNALTDATAKAHIEGLRQHMRGTLEPKAKQFDAQQAVFERYGIKPEMVEPIAKISGGLLATTQVPVQTENGVVMQEYMTTEPFWNELAAQSDDHLQTALYDAAWMFPDDLLKSIPKEAIFQAIGLNPSLAEVYAQVREDGTLNGLAPATSVNQDTLNSLPEDVRATFAEIAKADPEYAEELELIMQGATPRVAHQMLRTEKVQRERDAKDRQQEELRQSEQVKAREEAGMQRVSTFYEGEERAFMDDLAKNYLPYGTGEDAKADNTWLHNNIAQAVANGLRANPTSNRLLDGINDALKRGNQLAVAQLRTQLGPHIAELKKAEVARYDALFRRAIGTEQQQRAASANLKSVTGLGGFSEERQGNGLANTENLNDPANFLAMAKSLGVHIGQ